MTAYMPHNDLQPKTDISISARVTFMIVAADLGGATILLNKSRLDWSGQSVK
jgi:hypothetical protein